MFGVRRNEGGPTPILDVPGFLRGQVREVHLELDGHLERWLGGLDLRSKPSGSPAPALYLHAATVEDVAIHTLLLGEAPMFSTAWPGTGDARYAPVELDLIRNYARTVYAATDDFLAALSLEAASQSVDLSRLKLGRPTVAWVVSHFVVLELAHLGGELESVAHGSRAIVHPCADLYRS